MRSCAVQSNTYHVLQYHLSFLLYSTELLALSSNVRPVSVIGPGNKDWPEDDLIKKEPLLLQMLGFPPNP